MKPPPIYVDDGIPEDWGPPDDMDEGGRMKDESASSFIPHPSSFCCRPSGRHWRTLILTVTADERRALVALAEVQRRPLEETAAWLLRVALEDKGLLARMKDEG